MSTAAALRQLVAAGCAAAAAGCFFPFPGDGPSVTSVTGRAPGRVVIALDERPPAMLYGILVASCARAAPMWDVGQDHDPHPAPDSVVYGVSPPGFVERVPARRLAPGCYEVSTSGRALTRFEVAADGAVRTLPRRAPDAPGGPSLPR